MPLLSYLARQQIHETYFLFLDQAFSLNVVQLCLLLLLVIALSQMLFLFFYSYFLGVVIDLDLHFGSLLGSLFSAICHPLPFRLDKFHCIDNLDSYLAICLLGLTLILI